MGIRMGRTAAHVLLYLLSVALGGAPAQRVLMALGIVAAGLWAMALREVEVLAARRGAAKSHPQGKGGCNGNGVHVGSNGGQRPGPVSKGVAVFAAPINGLVPAPPHEKKYL